MAGKTITAAGHRRAGGAAHLRRRARRRRASPIDHPRFLSFVPAAPTEAAILFDLVVGASSIYAGSWLEGGGAVFAENEALRWIADLAGLPADGRRRVRQRRHGRQPQRARSPPATAGGTAPAAATTATRGAAADVGRRPLVGRPGGAGDGRRRASSCRPTSGGRLHGDALRATVDGLGADDRERLFAVVATAGTTNAGVVDDLAGAADAAAELGTWFHVDGAYGGAGPRRAERPRPLFAGIERADSFIVDPHKWLFAPFDCAACCTATRPIARAAHTQHAEYLDVLHRARRRSGTRATTPTTSPAGPAGCRSGSAWPRTAPTPIRDGRRDDARASPAPAPS